MKFVCIDCGEINPIKIYGNFKCPKCRLLVIKIRNKTQEGVLKSLAYPL